MKLKHNVKRDLNCWQKCGKYQVKWREQFKDKNKEQDAVIGSILTPPLIDDLWCSPRCGRLLFGFVCGGG